jgi:8-oxo-dGTP diphosphatase
MRLTVDIVLFGYVEKDLKILLVRRKYAPYENQWALPGGFVSDDESVDQAVVRELAEETGVSGVYLEQLYTFGEVSRDPRERIVSVSYYGLVSPDKFELVADTDAADAKWFSVASLPTLAFDHSDIIRVAHERLRGKVRYQPIGFELLPEKFPFSAIHELYQTILERPVDRRNLKKRLRFYGILDELDEKQENVPHRAGHLFSFNRARFEEKVKGGFYFEI